MMGGVSPETCWASYKFEIKFWCTVASCWIFFVNYTVIHGSTNIKHTLTYTSILFSFIMKLCNTQALVINTPFSTETSRLFFKDRKFLSQWSETVFVVMCQFGDRKSCVCTAVPDGVRSKETLTNKEISSPTITTTRVVMSPTRWPVCGLHLLGLRIWIPFMLGCLSVASVMSCQVEISTTGRSLVQRSNNQVCVYVCSWVSSYAPITFTPAMSKQKSSDLRKKEKRRITQQVQWMWILLLFTLYTEIHSTCSPSRVEGHFVELHFVFVQVAYFRTSLV